MSGRQGMLASMTQEWPAWHASVPVLILQRLELALAPQQMLSALCPHAALPPACAPAKLKLPVPASLRRLSRKQEQGVGFNQNEG